MPAPGTEAKAGEVDGLVLSEEPALLVQEAMQGILCLHAAKATIMLQRRGSSFINGKAIRNGFKGSGYGPQRAPELAPELLKAKRRESYGGDYSTVNSAQRVSATLSIRPRGRVQIIDM